MITEELAVEIQDFGRISVFGWQVTRGVTGVITVETQVFGQILAVIGW